MANEEQSDNKKNELTDLMENIHCDLVNARKIALFCQHRSYREIGLALDSIEKALILDLGTKP